MGLLDRAAKVDPLTELPVIRRTFCAIRAGQVRKSNHAITCREPIGQPAVLNQHWPAGSKITHAPIAEPAASHRDIAILWHAELPARALDKLAIREKRFRHHLAGRDLPP